MMDVGNLLKNVNNLNEYIVVTQYSSDKCRNSRIQLNMSTVLALKKIRSFEVEYVNKCEEMGIASVIFERLLNLPPSKTWGVLSKEIVNLLQYWLDAIRKHLVKHSSHWWTFLKLLLRFLKEIQRKDSSLPNMLVEYTAECLFDLATTDRPDVMQRYEILHCFNMYCSESTREIRFALRNKYSHYFIKLANYMSSCGNLPTQYSIMETLLRWLVPRQDRTLRITSASKWFPARLYANNVVDIFLERPWMNFFQDARDLLNTHNGSGDLITSVICRKLTVGDIIIISDTDRRDSWLDLNSASKSMSVLLDPRVLDAFGCTNHKSFETFVVSEDNTLSAKLSRESDILTLSVQTLSPPQVLPSCIKLGEDVSCYVTAVVSSRSDVKRLDGALRMIFDTKYQLLADLEKETIFSPPRVIEQPSKKSEEDSRFSHPVEVRRRKHSGYIVRPREGLNCASPSTASTSSLAHLHEKLAALPLYKFDKEPLSVCAPPNLSIVTEVSEADDRSTAARKRKAYGVCYQKNNTIVSNRKSQSDNETSRRCPEPKSNAKGRLLSPVVRDDTPSCLLVATVGSTDESVINDTIERLSKSNAYNPDNIVNLLVQEALNAKLEKDKDQFDSGINTREKTSQEINENDQTIEDTSNIETDLSKSAKKSPEIVPSTSDESNTEAISDTPNDYVNIRRKKKTIPRDDSSEKKCFDIQVVENFFSQHLAKNREQEVVISPTLAKKINETSSESSEDHLDNALMLMGDDLQNLDSFNFNNIEVIECLNNIVDKVCDEFNKCSEYLNKDQEAACEDNSDLEDDLPLKDILCKMQNSSANNKVISAKTSKKTPGTSKGIKLKYKVSSKKENRKAGPMKRKNKIEIQSTSLMSTIIEDNADTVADSNAPAVTEDIIANDKNNLVPDNTANIKTPMLRKKRKLFSPKDEKIAEAVPMNSQENKFVDNINKTPKSGPSYKPYKDIERERRKHIRMPRNRKSKKNESPSPRSKKMNELFDKVIESTNCEQVKLVNKTSDVYNFSSDSEGDFKKKKIEIHIKRSVTTTGSEESTVLSRRRTTKRINQSSKVEAKKTKRKANRRQITNKIDMEPVSDLIDERMREGKESLLNTSIVIENPEIVETEPVLVLGRPPEMEAITEKVKKNNKNQPKAKSVKNMKTKINSGKDNKKTVDGKSNVDTAITNSPLRELVDKNQQKAKNSKTAFQGVKDTEKTLDLNINAENDRPESSLSGLVVEDARTTVKDDGDLSAIKLFEKICQNQGKCINESNNTQNLLSDTEKVIDTSQTFNVTDEFIQAKEELKRKGRQSNNRQLNSVRAKTRNERIIKKDNSNKDYILNITLPQSETKSEQSIATVLITGHGDSEEAPPSPKLIVEQLEHRNLETEYLDASTKDYFEKLTDEINNINILGHNGSNEKNKTSSSHKRNQPETISASSHSRTSLKSPVVSVERISLEDISRWLPSRRNSESDYNSTVSSKSKNKLKDIKDLKVQSKHTTESENDRDKQDANESSSSVTQEKAVLKMNLNRERKDAVIKNNKNINLNKSTKDTKVITKQNQKRTRIPPPRNVKCTPRSNISPIKSFESVAKNASKLSQTTLSDDEEYMNDIKETLSKHGRQRQNNSQSSIDDEVYVRKLRHRKENRTEYLNKTISQKNKAEFVDSESIQDKMSTSTKIAGSTLKRKCEEDRDGRKKNRIEECNDMRDIISISGNTVSSVDDWFKRNEPSGSRGGGLQMSARDSLQTVMEKLDTTLIEIHQSTSKKLVHLFVGAQKQLSEIKETRRDIYKQTAAELLAGVVRLVDDKFSDLDKRSQEQDMNFMKHLKEQTAAVIREDCKRKRVMVQILKEDVQMALENVKRHTDQCSED